TAVPWLGTPRTYAPVPRREVGKKEASSWDTGPWPVRQSTPRRPPGTPRQRGRVPGVIPHSTARRRPAGIGSGLGLLVLGVRVDVDPPAGEAGGEAGVLPLLADRQRELEVGDDDA